MRWIHRVILTVVSVGLVTGFCWWAWDRLSLQSKVDRLERDRQELVEQVERLCASRRVAQVRVLEQTANDSGQTIHHLQWQEIGSGGTLGEPMEIMAVGKQVYFEGLVVKFDHESILKGNPERGFSRVLFRRIFGDQQKPESAVELRPFDDHGPTALTMDRNDAIWHRFWEIVGDPQLAREYGIRIAQSEAPSVVLQAGQIWEVSLDAVGGLNLHLNSQSSGSMQSP